MESSSLIRPPWPCQNCSKRKKRCELSEKGALACAHCVSRNIDCLFGEDQRLRKKRITGDLAERVTMFSSNVTSFAQPVVAGVSSLPPASSLPSTNSSSSVRADLSDPAKQSPQKPNSVSSISHSNRVDQRDETNTTEHVEHIQEMAAINVQHESPLSSHSHSQPNSQTGLCSPVAVHSVSNGQHAPMVHGGSHVSSHSRDHIDLDANLAHELSVFFGDDPFSLIERVSGASPADNAKPAVVTVADYDYFQESSLHNTLGLQSRYQSYVGPTGELDSLLISHYDYNEHNMAEFSTDPSKQNNTASALSATSRKIRCVSRISNVYPHSKLKNLQAFVLLQEQNSENGSQNDESSRAIELPAEIVQDMNSIQDTVKECSLILVDLFLKHVTSCYPLIHPGILLERFQRNIFELYPSVLAAIYMFSLNWWSFERELATIDMPSQSQLEMLGLRGFSREISKPTLSTIQSGLLLVQHQMLYGDQSLVANDSWLLMAQIVAAGIEIGLPLDPTGWDIPIWEKALRKRIAWSLYIQEKWSAVAWGRPSSIIDDNWLVPDLSLQHDFADILASQQNEGDRKNDSVDPYVGCLIFVEMINVTKILSEILGTVYNVKKQTTVLNTREELEERVHGELDLVKTFHLTLKGWYKNLPPQLWMSSTKRGRFSATFNIHLAFYAAEITLFRNLLRLLADTPQEEFVEIKKYIYRACFDLLCSAVDLVEDLKLQHLQTYWYSSGKHNLALIATFGFLLFVAADDLKMKNDCLQKMDEYRWYLTLNSKAAVFMNHAIKWIDHYNARLRLK